MKVAALSQNPALMKTNEIQVTSPQQKLSCHLMFLLKTKTEDIIKCLLRQKYNFRSF